MEKLSGIVERVTFFSEETGWSVLKVSPFDRGSQIIPVTVFQAKVFAGATVDFFGEWTTHPKYGEQFKAHRLVEKKPSTVAALEKYLGSGLIKGVGPKTAKRIVKVFGKDTLDVFENTSERLLEVPGIAQKKLKGILSAWDEHKEIRNVMMFLQSHGLSTLYAVKIYKKYGDQSIDVVNKNPYQLAKDIYGIGFLSSDKIALSIGIKESDPIRISAGILHILASSREEGHCYLTLSQILKSLKKLINISDEALVKELLDTMEENLDLCMRLTSDHEKAYYSKSLYYDELFVAQKMAKLLKQNIKGIEEQKGQIKNWLERYNKGQETPLSEEQLSSVLGIAISMFSILTGGPGCGKTTTTKTLVHLLISMKKKVTLLAPTGRAAQRMGEVIGLPAKTIHRCLIFDPKNGRFKHHEENQILSDFVIIDECSMLDISLTASLLKAIPMTTQILFIGDKNQLPSVGAGNVLSDLMDVSAIQCFRLTQVFRQAKESLIIKYAHMVNMGKTPPIESPIHDPASWEDGTDALFLDAEEATIEQLKFLSRVRSVFKNNKLSYQNLIVKRKASKKKEEVLEKVMKVDNDFFVEVVDEKNESMEELSLSSKFSYVDLQKVLSKNTEMEELKEIMKKIHPWSMLHYGMSAKDSVLKIYLDSIPKYVGEKLEIQILSPMTRGSMGTLNLNKEIQEVKNPARAGVSELKIGEKKFRVGDRVIQKKNNYDLEVFNGDIGVISEVLAVEMTLEFCCSLGKGKERYVQYSKENLMELDLAYAITIHKSQGSEFDVVIIPILTQHFKMLYRNLIYTGLTRAKKFVIFVGMRKALAMAVKNVDNRKRQTMLAELID